MIRELSSAAELRAACGDDDLVMWNAQDLGTTPGTRAWTCGEAVVAAAPAVSRRDRLAVWGDAGDAIELVAYALAELGPSYRPWGERELMHRVAAKVDGLAVAGAFSWMSLPAGAALEGEAAGSWLPAAAESEVAALLAAHAPDSYARPGVPGVRRWAGLRAGGELVAVAADAWPAPTVGLLAGVATAAAYRGRGLAERVCRWVTRELVSSYGRAALMVDDDNAAAIAVYERIGYRIRPVLATYMESTK